MLRVALLAALLLLPTASAWGFQVEGGADDVSIQDSPLVAGAIRANATGGAFGAPRVERASFGGPATVEYCPDPATGEPAGALPAGDAAVQCGGETIDAAGIYVFAGGFVAQAAPDVEVVLQGDAAVAALGGPNVTLNRVLAGPAIFAGGPTQIDSDGDAFVIRPLGSNASIEVRGEQGFRRYNGTGYTLRVRDADGVHVEARGTFLGGQNLSVQVTRAPIVEAERGLRVDDLFRLLRDVQPPERADRRAALADAFGPFQIVPALLNGALSAQRNATFQGAPQDEPLFVRVKDLTFVRNETRWVGAGNATYLVQSDVLAPRPGTGARLPLLAPVLLAALAVAGRALTPREAPPRSRRLGAAAMRIAGFAILALVAGAILKPLLGFSPLLDASSLALRSRVQLALLTMGMAGVAYVGVGLPVDSLARTAWAHRKRADAVLVPAAIGLVAALLFLLVASASLLAFVARYVRL